MVAPCNERELTASVNNSKPVGGANLVHFDAGNFAVIGDIIDSQSRSTMSYAMRKEHQVVW